MTAVANLLAVSILLAASSSRGQTSLSGTYSNLSYHEESGDLVGYEITFLSGKQSGSILFQCAQGADEKPVRLAIVAQATTIHFTVPSGASSCSGQYQATLTQKGLRLRGTETDELFSFRHSYWKNGKSAH